jgi:CubicO group peptidase (beta-lactamase class C family)
MARRLILLLALTGSLSGAAGAQAGLSSADTITRVLDRVFDRWRGTDGPGCAVGVSWRGHPVYTRAYGMANLETGTPMRPSSRFMLASVSKQFTAMAILLLERDGRLSIDDDIRKYVPEVPNYGTPVTIRHLLTHTSGLRDPIEVLYLARGRKEESLVTEADILDIVSRQKALNSAPDAEYHYNNGAYVLLGLIVKRVAGKPLRVFADERIFKPLGMMSTNVRDDVAMPVPERATAYVTSAGGWQLAATYANPPGAATVFATVDDLLKWETNIDRPVVGDRALFDAMQTSAVLTNGDSTHYGFGLMLGRYRGARAISHGGIESGYRAFLSRFPEHGFAIAIACNASSADPVALAQRVVDAFIGDSLAAVQEAAAPVAVKLPLAMLQRRVGAYIQPTMQELLQLTVRDGQLVAGSTALTAVSTTRFVGPFREITFADGEHAGFDVRLLKGGRAVPYVWLPPAVASPVALSAYAGEYCSEELDACLRVSPQDTVLTFRKGARTSLARPVFADGFTWLSNLVQFHRDGAKVSGFEVSNAEMRHVQFVRSPVRQ